VSGALMWLFTAGLVACGSGDKDPAAPTGGTGGTAAAPATGGTGGGDETGGTGGTDPAAGGAGGTTGGTGGTGGSSGSGGSGGDGGAGPVLDGTELDPGADGGGFDGVTLTGTDLVRAVAGCSAFDPTTGALALTLDALAPSVIVRVSGGIVTANGKQCVAADNKTKATTATVTSITITGGDEDSLVYIDGGAPFGETLLAGGGFTIDVGGGMDILSVLGSMKSDEVRVGSDGDAIVVDFTADLISDIHALGVEQVIVSTGPMPDLISGAGTDLGVEPVKVPMKLYGGGANDRLVGGAGDDELSGGIGNDTLLAGLDPGGADTLIGGDGEDFVDYAGRTAAITVTLTAGADDGEDGEHDQLDESVENIRGGDGDDQLLGGPGSNKLWGGAGNDVIDGGEGDDFIYGGAGDDDLTGGQGDDFLYGEAGDDTLKGGDGSDLLDGYPGKNTLDGGNGDADICVPTTADTAHFCEL
jgi:hypothetical protein